MFGLLLRHVPGDTAAAERAMIRVYARVWRTAPVFDPAVLTGGAFLLKALLRETAGRDRGDHVVCAHATRGG